MHVSVCKGCYKGKLIYALIGIGYMTFGEKLDTFNESRDILEFQDAAMKMIGSISELIIGTPFYKVFPTKAYKDFLYGNNYVMEYGMHIYL